MNNLLCFCAVLEKELLYIHHITNFFCILLIIYKNVPLVALREVKTKFTELKQLLKTFVPICVCLQESEGSI